MRTTRLPLILCLTAVAALALQPAPIHARRGDALILLPGPNVQIAPDQKIALTIQTVDDKGNIVPTTIDTLTSVAWRVNGHDVSGQSATDGHLAVTPVLSRATFVAPHDVPARNPIAVSVTFKDSTSGAATTLVTNLTVVDQENYFTISGPVHPDGHTSFQLEWKNAPAASRRTMANARALGNGLTININPMEPREDGRRITDGTNAHLVLMVNGAAAGNYDWVPFTTSISLLIVGPQGTDNFSSFDCTPHGDPNCKQHSLPGTTTILSNDPSTHELRGAFSGMINLYKNGMPSDAYSAITGHFVAIGAGALGYRLTPSLTVVHDFKSSAGSFGIVN